MYSIITQVIDNDSKGTRGGTKYRLTVSEKGTVIETVEYTILQMLQGFTTHIDLIAIYKERNKQIVDARNTEQQKAQLEERTSRLNNAIQSVTDVDLQRIAETLDNHPDLIQQYRSGNAKAVNVIMGKLVKQINVEPSALITLIKQLIEEKSL